MDGNLKKQKNYYYFEVMFNNNLYKSQVLLLNK